MRLRLRRGCCGSGCRDGQGRGGGGDLTGNGESSVAAAYRCGEVAVVADDTAPMGRVLGMGNRGG